MNTNYGIAMSLLDELVDTLQAMKPEELSIAQRHDIAFYLDNYIGAEVDRLKIRLHQETT